MRHASRKVFDKIARLREAGDAKAIKRLSNSWVKRRSNNVTGFYDPRKAKVVS